MDGCDNRHQARGLCSTHYNQQHQPNRHRKVEMACDYCGEMTEKARTDKYEGRFCDFACRDLWGLQKRGHLGRPPMYGPPTPKPEPADMRSPLRRALEDGTGDDVIAAIKADCDVRPNGCWEWQRSISKEGYGTVAVAKRYYSVHRLTLEARLGAPLGPQPAHHICANTFCANPDHLVPVTHAENVAEMMARRYMEQRIRSLESALRSVLPDHPLLSEVGLPPSA